jgi:hypothetical protein
VVDRLAADLLVGHICVGADHGAGRGQARGVLVVRVGQLGDAEVEHLDEVGVAVALAAEAVLGLHVAVHDILGVGDRQRAADLNEDVLRARPRQRTLAS